MRKPPVPAASPLASPAIPAPGEGKRGVDGYVGYLLRQAAAAYRLRMERALADLGVTPPQFSVLTMLVAYPGLSGADLARLSLLTPQTVSLIIANLERSEAIVRRPHPTHGRVRVIDVTAAGRLLLDRCKERVRATERGLLDGLPADEERVIRRWLVKIAREESDVMEEGIPGTGRN
ncbi:MarR family transcriptional regulator [Zoogloea sp.]|uniref:MarR family winged helix-turn-helix transcriptional regulator n=1 Tax=Zoogloea sp. TaxID=49181 RepID=UPI00141614D2|nr:MAG: MarR family transcriptional regulator [Zoogloea sp.]